jgi:predicted O-methyltransferase YrrM
MADLRKYLKQKGYNLFEGSCYNQREQQELLKELIKGKNKGLEIGFNAGDSAYLFLKQECELTSCDIFLHNYTYEACDFLRNKYNGKFFIIKGDSQIILPQLNDKYDFIYVDGNHRYSCVKNDLKNIINLCDKNTLVIIDDYVLEPDNIRKYNEGVIQGVAEFEEFEVIGQRDFGPGRGLIWGKIKHNYIS